MDRKPQAIHEAGHAVADAMFEFLPSCVSIIRRGISLGRCLSYHSNDKNDEHEIEHRLVSLFAGYAAQVLIAGGDELEAWHGARDDREKAAVLLKRIDGSEDEQVERALGFVSDPAVRRRIELVAEELLHHEVLDGDEIDIITDEDFDPDDLRQFRELAGDDLKAWRLEQRENRDGGTGAGFQGR